MHGTVYIDYKLTEIKLLITDMHVHLNYMYVSINCLTLLQESDSVQQTADTYYEDMTVTSEKDSYMMENNPSYSVSVL